jgi:hypothetical protein
MAAAREIKAHYYEAADTPYLAELKRFHDEVSS